MKVIMGDHNMALFRAISDFRSRGIEVDVGAWYPWESLQGEPMSDSCGMFFVNLPEEYRLRTRVCLMRQECKLYGMDNSANAS